MQKHTTLASVLALARTGTVIFADAEYLHGDLASRARPQPHVWKDAVQIGAVKYSSGSKVATFQALIRPSVLPPSSTTPTTPLPGASSSGELNEDAWSFFEELTALPRTDLVSKGRPFAEVWNDFKDFVDNNPIIIMLGDKEVYKWTHKLRGTPKDEEIDAMEWIRLKPLLGGKTEDGKEVGLGGLDSGQLYSVVGLSKDEVCPGLSGHDALFDACSMALFCTKYKS